MISKREFIIKKCAEIEGGNEPEYLSSLESLLDTYWNEMQEAVSDVIENMPSIGWVSIPKRIHAFCVACEIVEKRVEKGTLDFFMAMMALDALRYSYKPFRKATDSIRYASEQDLLIKGGFPQTRGELLSSYGSQLSNYFTFAVRSSIPISAKNPDGPALCKKCSQPVLFKEHVPNCFNCNAPLYPDGIYHSLAPRRRPDGTL
jgi:hypothetical protein